MFPNFPKQMPGGDADSDVPIDASPLRVAQP